MRKPDDQPVTWGELRKVYKKLDTRIDESFDHANQLSDNQSSFWDEHEDKIGRLSRALNRLRKRVEDG